MFSPLFTESCGKKQLFLPFYKNGPFIGPSTHLSHGVEPRTPGWVFSDHPWVIAGDITKGGFPGNTAGSEAWQEK